MSKHMASRERVSATVQGRMPDRISHLEWSVAPIFVKTLANGESYEHLIELLDIDAIMTGPDYTTKNIGDLLWLDEWGFTTKPVP